MGRGRTATRERRSDGARSHRSILDASARIATVRGIEGLTIGSLASELEMSKSGLYAHFGSKRELQLATIERAYEIFLDAVISPALERARGVERLRAACDEFLDHLERRDFPGGCFFASAAADSPPGPVRERLAGFLSQWLAFLERLAREAQDAGELDPELDPKQLVFELNALLLAANSSFLLLQGRLRPFARARAGIEAKLGS
jgi:AcrR family transcriptional regulator